MNPVVLLIALLVASAATGCWIDLTPAEIQEVLENERNGPAGGISTRGLRRVRRGPPRGWMEGTHDDDINSSVRIRRGIYQGRIAHDVALPCAVEHQHRR